jgi:hypothetical protein
VLGYGHAGRLLTPLPVPQVAQLAGWGVLLALAVVAAAVFRGRLGRVTTGLNAITTALIVVALVSIVPGEVARSTRASTPPPVTSIGGGGGTATRDIYYIVLDRYGSRASLRARYGIETDLPAWLRDRGFVVNETSHANYPRTALSLASTLNMTFLDGLTERLGRDSTDLAPVNDMIKDHHVGRFLRERGYRYIHIGSWFGPTVRSPIADVNLNRVLDSEFADVFYRLTILPTVAERLGMPGARRTFRDTHRDRALYQFQKLSEVRSLPGPKFVFAHILLPHPPHVFGRDGRPVAAAEETQRPEAELFAEQVAYTDARVKEILEPLLAQPDATRPIVIVQGDEGPYLPPGYDRSRPDTQRVALVIRYGILNAISWPGSDASAVPPTLTAVNTFRLLLGGLFGADLPLLPDRMFAWRGSRIYDYRDVTRAVLDAQQQVAPAR